MTARHGCMPCIPDLESLFYLSRHPSFAHLNHAQGHLSTISFFFVLSRPIIYSFIVSFIFDFFSLDQDSRVHVRHPTLEACR